MIQSFADATTKDIYDDVDSKAARRIPKAIWPVVRRKLDALDAAPNLEDLRHVPGNQLEALTRDLAGQFSIRVNRQYRLIFRFASGHAYDVRCGDYH